MSTEDFFKKHLTEKTELKVFLTGDPTKTTMLSGKILAYDEYTILLNKCLIYQDKIISITPL